MSFRPFSSSEIENLRGAIEQKGWMFNGVIENYFRYSIKKDKFLLFTIKFPISFPLRINIPFEVASFKISVAIKFWDLNQNTNKIIFYFMKTLRDLAFQISLEHDFPIKGKEQELIDLLNLLMPETIKNENDSTWLNRIRISLMNKRDKFYQVENLYVKKVGNILKTVGLFPTFKLPWELKRGVPKIRTTETLFYSNDEPFDEFFIVEKGYYSYFKDLEYNKCYIRSSFDCYTPYILGTLFSESELKFGNLVEKWIKFSRMMLNSIIEIINASNIYQNDFIQIKPERDLKSNDFEESENNFPFIALHYESSINKGELYPIHHDLLNSPPESFEVIESLNTYTEAEELIKNYRFEEATQLLNQSLKIFNKHRQKKVVISILFKLYRIASLLNQNEIAHDYLESTLGVAKSGEIPIEYIIKIHYKLGKSYYIKSKFVEASKQFDVIIQFLEKEEPSLNKEEYLGLAYLYLGLIDSEENQLAKAKEFFKKAFQSTNKSIRVKLEYHLLRAKNFKEKGNISQSQKLLRAGIDAVGIDFDNEKLNHKFMDLILELAEHYIHHRVDSRKALYLLKTIESKLSLASKEIPGIRRGIRWNLLMCDYYDILKQDSNNSTYHYKQSQVLINQLKKIGVIN